jgi:hypothetical protein
LNGLTRWVLIGLPAGWMLLYNVLYSFNTVCKSSRVGFGGRSPECLYHRCKVFHASLIQPSFKCFSMSFPAAVVRCLRSWCSARFMRRDNLCCLPGRNDRFLLFDAHASINFHVTVVIQGALACHSMFGACTWMHHFNLSYSVLILSCVVVSDRLRKGNRRLLRRYLMLSALSPDHMPPITIRWSEL